MAWHATLWLEETRFPTRGIKNKPCEKGHKNLVVRELRQHLKEGPEGGYRSLQACQSDVSGAKVMEQINLSAIM